jgi:signal transduction histidine kinase
VNEQLQAIEAEYGKAAAAKALRTCERYTELLVGSMVHDLRSMLTHLKMNCYSLIESHPGDKPGSKSRRAAARVRSDLDFMELAIADMEVFARPVASERRPERLADVIAAALELACDNVRKSKLDPDAVNVKLDVPGVIVVEMARHQITLALANVLKNAFEAFLADGKLRAGSIQIEVVAVGDQVRITVRDDGMGMVEEESRGLLFFTPGRRNKSKQNSTGYGLPIAARNVAAHGGSIALESRGNEGTVVTIILPLSSL